MNQMDDFFRLMMDPMGILQRGTETIEAYQTMLAARAEMLRAMAAYSEATAALTQVMLKPIK